ncbi:retrovirus-related pol polyprotein from transposon TNT 1-94, partial [Tanacetum coccineum]
GDGPLTELPEEACDIKADGPLMELPKVAYDSKHGLKLRKCFGEADLSKDTSGPKLSTELWRSWWVEGHIKSEFISSVLRQRYQRTLRQSVARTPQQNGVVERRNRTLIEAARTMLADSKLPTTFWAEAVNTACYVQNRVLVVKPHNKTPYELFHGRTPTLSFMRPFGCPVTILNTIDHLGKFDGKADEGFFVGYSINSKAFRVFNNRTRIVEENLHIQFSENTPIIAGSGTKACDDVGKASMETVPGKDYILLPLWTTDPPFSQISKSSPDAGFKPSSDDGKKVDEDSRKILSIQMMMKMLVSGDLNNLDAFMPVSPIPTTRVHKDHPVEQIIEDLNSTPQTRRMTKNLEEHGLFSLVQQRTNHKDFQNCLFPCFLSQVKPKKVALQDPCWIEAMQDELLQFKLQKVWTLVDLPNGKRPIGTKWVFRNKKGKRGIVIKNKARLVTQGYTQEEGIDYDEVFAPVVRIEAITLFLAYASFKYFVVYQMDVKSAFLYSKIEEEVYMISFLVLQKKSLCTEFEKMMHKKFQMSSMGKLTFFLGLQVKQKEDGIFISQDKYVTEILKKFSFTDVKTASTPMETQKLLLKDEDGEEVDVYLYRSMIGSLMYLTSLRPEIMFAVCACARYQVNPKMSHLYVVKRIFRYLKCQPKLGLWYLKDSSFDLVAYTDSDYAGASLDKKSTTRVNAARHNLQLLVFWATVKEKTVNGEVQLQALVDGKKIIITESIVRRDLQLEDVEGIDCLPSSTIFEQLTLMSAKTTAWNKFSSTMASAIIFLATNQKFNFLKYIFESIEKNLENVFGKFLMYPRFVQDRGNINKTQSKATPNEPSSPGTSSGGGPKRQETMGDTIAQTRSENVYKHSNDQLLARGNTLQSGEDRLKLEELMEFCTKLQQRVLDLENTKTAQAQEITSLKLRVNKLEKKGGSRTHKLKRLYKEDTSKQGRKIDDIDKDAEITLIDETQGRYGDDLMFDTGVLDDEEVFAGQDMDEKEINVAEKEVSIADPVSTAGEVVTTASPTETTTTDDLTLAQTLIQIRSAKSKVKGVTIREQSESITRTRPQQLPSKDKGKGIMEDPEKPTNKKDQIRHDEEVAQRLQAQMQAKLEEEDRLVRHREEEANIVSWDNVQAMIDANYQMGQQMQEEEQEKLSIKEKSKLFV